MPPAYRASLTREPFLFREMRVTAREVLAGADDAAVIERISSQNLYQYPTERSLRGMARACLRRLHLLGDAGAVRLIAEAPAALSRQLCLYALMKDNRLVAEFLVQVVGENTVSTIKASRAPTSTPSSCACRSRATRSRPGARRPSKSSRASS